jgi:superfamily II DNA or RNA helicase
MQLRPYQLAAVDAIQAELSRVRSTLLVLATGLGKTVTFAEVARRVVARGGRVLVVAHRGELLTQAASTLARFGLTTGIEQGDERVDVVALPDVTVASVQTLRGKRLARFGRDAFALVVIDESHHATAKSYGAILDHFDAAKVLGVTATPDRADGVGLRHAFDSVAFTMDLAAGIEAGFLSPLTLRSVRVASLDLSTVRTVAGDFAAGDLERELMRDRALHEVAAPLAELSGGRQTLAFVAGVAQAHALASVLEGYGVRAAAVDGSMSPTTRAAVLADYRAGRVQIVANAMLWTEGFDAPETSCIALVRPTRSRSLITQMIGRGSRLAEGKRNCLVLDFVPGRLARVRLASPADALAGSELPDDIITRVCAASGLDAGDLRELIAQARADKAAAQRAVAESAGHQARERNRLIREVGVVYAAARFPVAQLLTAMLDGQPTPVYTRPASGSQLAALASSGFELPENLSVHEASLLLEIVARRRKQGLCTIKQARRLRSYGLRDDVSFADACVAFDAIRENRWRPPRWLFGDARFAMPRENAA